MNDDLVASELKPRSSFCTCGVYIDIITCPPSQQRPYHYLLILILILILILALVGWALQPVM